VEHLNERNRHVTDSFVITASTYGGRTAYLPKFFQLLAEELKLSPASRVLDAACGRGEMAIGLSPFVREVVAVDRSSEMLEAVGIETPMNIQFRQATIGDNSDLNLGVFDAVTIGRALRYLPREAACAFFAEVLPAGKALAVCSSGLSGKTSWREIYENVKQEFGYEMGASKFVEQEYLQSAPFDQTRLLIVSTNMRCTLASLIQDALSYRSLRRRIEADMPAFRMRLAEALAPYFDGNGVLVGEVTSIGMIFVRR
jgi:SAM-dependent methyltransferase